MGSLMAHPIRILLVEDNPGDVDLFRNYLDEIEPSYFIFAHTDRLQDGIRNVQSNAYDILVLDLFLPDSQGIETVRRASEQVHNVPIVVLTINNDDQYGIAAIQAGAQDYLVKQSLTGDAIRRTIRYAIERQRLMHEIRELSLKDELTGLHNRRGFQLLLPHQIALAQRTSSQLLLLNIDIDHMKGINDQHGHGAGDRALRETAELLRRHLRQSDVVARVGGDEFVASVLIGPKMASETIIQRLMDHLAQLNQDDTRPFTLSLSFGSVTYDPFQDANIEAALQEADARMYAQKQARKAALEAR